MCVVLQPLTLKWRSHVRLHLDVIIKVEVTHNVTICPIPIMNIPSPIAGSICSSLVLWSQLTDAVHTGGLHHYMRVLELAVFSLYSASTTVIGIPSMHHPTMTHLRPPNSAIDYAKHLHY